MTKKRGNNIRENISSPYSSTNDNVNEWLGNRSITDSHDKRQTRKDSNKYWTRKDIVSKNSVLTPERESVLNKNMKLERDTGKLKIWKPEDQKAKYPHVTAANDASSQGGSEIPQYRQTHFTTKSSHKGLTDSDATDWMKKKGLESSKFRNVRNAFKETKDKKGNKEIEKNLTIREGKKREDWKDQQTRSWLSNPNNTGDKELERNLQRQYYQGQPPKK